MSVARVRIVASAFIAVLLFVTGGETAEEFIPLDRLLSKEYQSRLGLEMMRAEQRELLRQTLLSFYRQGYERGKQEGLAVASRVAPTARAIETQIDGEFNGWDGETIDKLMNGQIWQQTEYHYEYYYAFMPNVLVYPATGGFKMKVEGTSQAVGVQRLK
jgi:hypothetical protein